MEFLYETHMHTSEVSACAGSTAEEQVFAYKNRGYAGIIVTDHFINGHSTCPRYLPWNRKMKHILSGYNKAKIVGDKCGIDVFLGWEFTVKGSDFLTYGLDLDFLLSNPNCDKLAIEDYSKLVRKHGGYLAQAHPFRDKWYIDHKCPVDHHLLDGVEVYNALDSSESNKNSLAFAERHGLAMQAGSDSHSAEIYHCGGIKLDKKASSIHDIIEALKTKKAFPFNAAFVGKS